MFWDSSALVPAILPGQASTVLLALLGSDRQKTIWWACPVECQSAVFRRHRQEPLPAQLLGDAMRRLADVLSSSDVVPPTTTLRQRAGRLLGAHPLRAGDALQLAAALLSSDDAPQEEAFVCLDARLRDAARREGFAVLPA
jgi:predicted nucleic acid-binding protein